MNPRSAFFAASRRRLQPWENLVGKGKVTDGIGGNLAFFFKNDYSNISSAATALVAGLTQFPRRFEVASR